MGSTRQDLTFSRSPASPLSSSVVSADDQARFAEYEQQHQQHQKQEQYTAADIDAIMSYSDDDNQAAFRASERPHPTRHSWQQGDFASSSVAGTASYSQNDQETPLADVRSLDSAERDIGIQSDVGNSGFHTRQQNLNHHFSSPSLQTNGIHRPVSPFSPPQSNNTKKKSWSPFRMFTRSKDAGTPAIVTTPSDSETGNVEAPTSFGSARDSMSMERQPAPALPSDPWFLKPRDDDAVSTISENVMVWSKEEEAWRKVKKGPHKYN
eukprot:jgi/Hompol1/2010/HPOL_005822-RA